MKNQYFLSQDPIGTAANYAAKAIVPAGSQSNHNWPSKQHGRFLPASNPLNLFPSVLSQ